MTPVPQPFSLDQSQTRHHPVTGIEPYHSAFPLFYYQKNKLSSEDDKQGVRSHTPLYLLPTSYDTRSGSSKAQKMEVYEHPLFSIYRSMLT